MKSSNKTPMEKLTQGYEKFIKGKGLSTNGKEKFEKTLKKAAKSKSKK